MTKAKTAVGKIKNTGEICPVCKERIVIVKLITPYIKSNGAQGYKTSWPKTCKCTANKAS